VELSAHFGAGFATARSIKIRFMASAGTIRNRRAKLGFATDAKNQDNTAGPMDVSFFEMAWWISLTRKRDEHNLDASQVADWARQATNRGAARIPHGKRWKPHGLIVKYGRFGVAKWLGQKLIPCGKVRCFSHICARSSDG
jgi:hypothetical protein